MSKIYQTSERETLDLLKSHYYKASYDQIKAVYLEYLEQNGFNIVNIDDNYLEIYAELGTMTVISKIIMQNPKETSIDCEIISEAFLGGKRQAYGFLQGLYKKIEERYELKGLALHLDK
ncbi:MAG: hypothetical protein IJU60_01365 [Acholeplasmatales bacterium]|nr:hypothetical protein [Acholeplasmatales bacterium]